MARALLNIRPKPARSLSSGRKRKRGIKTVFRRTSSTNSEFRRNARKRMRGYSFIEIVFAMVVGIVLTAIAVPLMQSTLRNYRFRSAVADAAWAIRATRYQAIMKGYPYAVTFNAQNNTYQVKNQPVGAANMVNVGNPIPLAGSKVALSQDTTLEFRPNGLVLATQGQLSFAMTYVGKTKTLAVSRYGHVTITP